jgi:phage recombination protein Bet
MSNELVKKQSAPTDFELMQKGEAKSMEFVPFGGQDKIKLSVAIVQRLIAVPTKRGETCSERDALKFMMMCQAKRLNPFEGDAFLIGYDTQNGPSFSLITAHQAFLKRAEVHPEFDGMKSGIIILGDDGKELIEREGDFHLPGEDIVGGWATVFFKNRKIPTTRKVRMSRFNKGFAQWKDDPAGMICKCAEADAMRSSFPTMVGGLYLREEMDFMPDQLVTKRPLFEAKEQAQLPTPKILEKPAAEAPQPDAEPERQGDPEPDPQPQPVAEAPTPANGSQKYLKGIRGLLNMSHISEGELLDFLAKSGVTDGSIGSLEELSLSNVSILQMVFDQWSSTPEGLPGVSKQVIDARPKAKAGAK